MVLTNDTFYRMICFLLEKNISNFLLKVYYKCDKFMSNTFTLLNNKFQNVFLFNAINCFSLSVKLISKMRKFLKKLKALENIFLFNFFVHLSVIWSKIRNECLISSFNRFELI